MVISSLNEGMENFYQKFYYTPLQFGSVSSDKIMEMIQRKTITKREVKIMCYLYKFRCAPFEYIVRDVVPGLKDDEYSSFKELMDFLVKQRILNEFYLTDNTDAEWGEEDALLFYTLDYGALTILKSVLKDETLEDWKASDTIMTGNKVRKCLMNIDFYHKLTTECQKNVEYYNTYQCYSAYKTRIENKGTLRLNGKIYFVEAVCEGDLYDGSDTKLFSKITKYEKLLGIDEVWHYFFEDIETPPVLIILCDTKRCAERFSMQVDQIGLPYVRYVCLGENKPLELSFYKHEEGKLIPVKAKSFAA